MDHRCDYRCEIQTCWTCFPRYHQERTCESEHDTDAGDDVAASEGGTADVTSAMMKKDEVTTNPDSFHPR